QPQSEVAPVQVVGILEAAGLRFDHLWVLGLSDDRWPAAATPNPLLPITLQRELNLPHASSRRELEYTALITERILASAAEVVMSHATSDGGSELRVSPLIAEVPLASLEQLELAHTIDMRSLGFGAAELEQLVDDAAPPLPPGSHLRGGSGLLADQSACPFRAFAKHRLGAKVVEDPVSGVDARIKGIMVHRVLQRVWERLGTQEQLLRLAEPELRQLVDDEVGRELNRLRPSRPETLAPRFIQMEQERVTGLILEWLGVERERAPFAVVALEQKQTVEISGLQLDIVADRVDRIANGSNLIIDYKTGKYLTHKGWFEERIEEPQLPLYATTNVEEVSGVFLAGISRATMKFTGVSEVDGLVPGIKAFADSREAAAHAGWDGLRRDWQERLQLLATEILQGQAGVRPKNPTKECLYCPLPTLCRIDEQDVADGGEGSQ
ncbi:MAG: PD-(D/E)XK nuclease family protein, partial [Gammaproteobacteria bacterium]|nr:PD-(D/E)XK nuclease family protein [Gammaproteobacteria bacterium]